MLPQIQQLQNGSDEEKQELVSKGLAHIDESGKMFLSLEAVDVLGMQVLNQNPLVMVSKFLGQQGIKLTPAAQITDANIAESLTEKLYNVMERAAILGIPIYQCFNAFMQVGADYDKVDYEAILKQWQQFVANSQQHQKEASTVQ